mmetsp:Transcript_23025/g.49719  ORF Transcript_23025/g.49719 Transcript_23025/m.49719 type:complete len:85 (+) Transcript_23025:1551-1805(+)
MHSSVAVGMYRVMIIGYCGAVGKPYRVERRTGRRTESMNQDFQFQRIEEASLLENKKKRSRIRKEIHFSLDSSYFCESIVLVEL